MDFRAFIGKVRKYQNVKDEQIKKQTLEEMETFIEEQKQVVLSLDNDVEHLNLYKSESWKKLNELSLQDIINDPKNYEKSLNELKLETIDRNFLNVRRAMEIRESIEICFQQDIFDDINESKRFLATIDEYNNNQEGKFGGIISKEEISNIKSIIKYRQKITNVTEKEKSAEYIGKLKRMEHDFEYSKFVEMLKKRKTQMDIMQLDKLRFSEKCETQIRNILSGETTKNINFDELKLSLYMMIFSQYFDDRNPLEVSETDLERIIERVWIPSEPSTDIGKIYMTKERYQEFLDIQNSISNSQNIVRKAETRWILSQIRNAIMHGSFQVFMRDSQKLINVFGNEYKSTFKFDCLIDICEELFKSSNDKNIPNTLEELVASLKTLDKENAKEILTENKLDLFDLYINSVFSYNEDLFHKKRDIMFTGINGIKDGMTTHPYMGHIRNSVAHRYRKIENDEIIIMDGENQESIQEEARINFNNFSEFVHKIDFMQNVMSNLEIENEKAEKYH